MQLRPYQIEDAEFLVKQNCTACFNEQRTGKTPTALETLKLRNIINEKNLIITTASSVYQWAEEFEKWLNKPCSACVGTIKQKEKAIQNWTHGLIISIDSFKETKNSEGLINPILKDNPKQLILDEAHKIKNPKSANAKALYKTKSIPYRLALTGTPGHGKAYDIFPILKFLFPNEFRGYWRFIDEYFVIEEETIYVAGRPKKIKKYETFKEGKDLDLQKLLSTFSTQRKRKDVMPWLPEKTYTKVRLKPTQQQKKALRILKEEFKIKDNEIANTLEQLIRERQICLDPELLEIKSKSPKTEWIKQYIKDNPEEQIIVFSKFTSYLYKLATELGKSYALIVGETPIERRNKFKTDFQNHKFQTLLINIDAGKEAITLDAAEATIFTDKYPPIGDIEQAEDRFIASTPEKANKAHKIYELMISETYDEVLYDLLHKRKTETDIINNYNKYLERS